MPICNNCGYEYETIQCPCSWDIIKDCSHYSLATLDDFDRSFVLALTSAIDYKKCFLLLHGPFGCGKTHLAISLAKMYALTYKFSGKDICILFSGSMNEKNLFDINNSKVLIIDNLDYQKDFDAIDDKIMQAILKRVSSGKFTIVTSFYKDLEKEHKDIYDMFDCRFNVRFPMLDIKLIEDNKINLYKFWLNYMKTVIDGKLKKYSNVEINNKSINIDKLLESF